MTSSLSLPAIQEARRRIAAVVRRTPLMTSASISEQLGTHGYLKMEVFQKTGSFKVRGAFNKALALPTDGSVKGLIAVSGGNHAQAIAYAAKTLGLKALILMPEGTPQQYVSATRGYGGEVKFARDVSAAFNEVADYGRQGWVFVHPFDDPQVMAGQGTIGLELLDDLPQMTDLVLSIGGGGLMSGVATAIKGIKPTVRIWGVETVGADCMAQSLAENRIVTLPQITSIARTLGAPAPSETTFVIARRVLESVTVVPDSEAMDSMRFLLERAKVLTEPAASCTLAAAIRLRDRFTPDDHVVLLLCGGNMAIGDLARLG